MALGEYRGPIRMDVFACYVLESLRQRLQAQKSVEYIADALHYRGKGMYPSVKLHDLLHPPKAEEFDPDEIIVRIIEEAGLEVTT